MLSSLSSAVEKGSALPCLKKEYPDGIVCVCTEEYCDTLENVDLIEKDDIVLVSTSMAGLRFEVTHSKHGRRNSFIANSTKYGINIMSKGDALHPDESTDNLSNLLCMNIDVTVNRSITYQTNVGFGGAFTGAVSHVMETIPKKLQNHVYRSYFSKTEGIGYTMIRMPIGGSDFDFVPWAHQESPVHDASLSNFLSLDKRDFKRISQLSDLKSAAGIDEIKFIGAAWSPPPWMKTNNDWTGLSTLKPEYYRTWAQYHLKFLELMADRGIHFWAFSTGNEPLNGLVGWFFIHFMSLGWTASEQAIWVGEHLGPLLRNSSFKDVKLLGGDDQRFVMPYWFEQMNASHKDALRYLDGFAVHWYWNDVTPVVLLDDTHRLFPDKFILNTESCIVDKLVGVFPMTFHGPLLGSWERAEQYAQSYIEDFTHWVVGWVDWNIVLDEAGGPNYVNGTVDAPIIVNTTAKNEFYKQPMFYAIGHFSRFIVENSTRIKVHSSNDCVLTVGYQRPDKSIVIVLFNKDSQKTNIKLRDGNTKIRLTVPPRSIHTLVYY
ncbi:lysosomal acid glucosylceramidase-like isoform X2 [Bradysia coprophila]|uniref:lysosomal acid glucosylceramidase-like isoform X2 n=1 Tax=Bradysia coprophila TaxID=38358 RepID=UPI00187DD069|nr:lysosomal acid glucosylceramidase-like isoform X2 [Bradysia coprophila]